MHEFLPQTYPAKISIKVIPQAPQTKIMGIMNSGVLKIAVCGAPEKGKANTELIKFFKKNFRLQCTILQGETNRHKVISLSKKEISHQ